MTTSLRSKNWIMIIMLFESKYFWKLRICEAKVTNCEVWYGYFRLRISEITNCEGYELRGIPVLHSNVEAKYPFHF